MSKPTPEQILSALSVLAGNTTWEKVSHRELQAYIDDPKGLGRRFTYFLQNGCRLGTPTVLNLTGAPFDLKEFGVEGAIPQTHEPAVSLTSIDLTKVRFGCPSGMVYDPTSRKCCARHPEKMYISLSARVFQTLWEKKYLIPESWEGKHFGQNNDLFFVGTMFHTDKSTVAICIFWNGKNWIQGISTYRPDDHLQRGLELLLEVDKEPAPAEV